MTQSSRKATSDSNSPEELRGDSRRSLYLGERFHCRIEWPGVKPLPVELVDISPKGLALLCTQATTERALKDGWQQKNVRLHFNRQSFKFSVDGKIVNRSTMTIRGQKYQRYGVQFEHQICQTYEQFDQALEQNLVLCKSYVRPQATCWDPFFFQEAIYFHVHGFTPEGMDVVVSSRWKSILPQQPLELEVYIPGHGLFKVSVCNQNLIYQSPSLDRFRIYLRYQNAPLGFQEAVSEYLLTMNEEATPAKLRLAGFRLGQISQAFELRYGAAEQMVNDPAQVGSSALAMPDVASIGRQDRFKKRGRYLLGKVGRHQALSVRLLFFEDHETDSELTSLGYRLPQAVQASRFIEVSQLLLSHEVGLSDIFIPLMRHIIRVAAQSQMKYVLLESDVSLKKILELIGFTPHGPRLSRLNEDMEELSFQLMILDVNATLSNQQHFLEGHVWRKVYQGLSDFLGRNYNQPKTIKPYKFPKKT